ncbi:MAG: hypothetical protein M1833_007026 [Piccolia ochrophora]|nr:MAG: hypothetical protein M1833_007026 [Piccolia ochrophora]
MADPISISSGLLTLVTFALQSSKILYHVVEGFQSAGRNIRDLKQELEALDGVLQSLQEVVNTTSVDLSALKLPLLRCGKACKEFEAVVVKCTIHSDGTRTSLRDRAKLTYMGEDIVGFRNMLAGYKSTITIALGDANLRTATVTAEVLNEYKEMIKNTTSDLKEHLQEIDHKLQSFVEDTTRSNEEVAERQRMLEEREGTQQCLSICAQVSAHIDRVQPDTVEDVPVSSDANQVSTSTLPHLRPARLLTRNILAECQRGLTITTSELERHLQEIDQRLNYFSLEGSSERTTEQSSMREELNSVKRCLAICSKAAEQAAHSRTNVFEDVTMRDDGHQVIVSTLGDLVSAKRITVGARSTQWLGQMSDASLQHLSQERTRAKFNDKGKNKGKGKDRDTEEEEDEEEDEEEEQ